MGTKILNRKFSKKNFIFFGCTTPLPFSLPFMAACSLLSTLIFFRLQAIQKIGFLQKLHFFASSTFPGMFFFIFVLLPFLILPSYGPLGPLRHAHTPPKNGKKIFRSGIICSHNFLVRGMENRAASNLSTIPCTQTLQEGSQDGLLFAFL